MVVQHCTQLLVCQSGQQGVVKSQCAQCSTLCHTPGTQCPCPTCPRPAGLLFWASAFALFFCVLPGARHWRKFWRRKSLARMD